MFNRLAVGAVLVTMAVAASAPAAIAEGDRPLSKVAAELGYTYGYLGPEDAASLTRPGVTILIRPGQRIFDVNDRTEAIEGPPPHFEVNDIVISSALAARLAQIASTYPSSLSDRSTVQNVERPAEYEKVAGAITNLRIAQIPGQQMLSVVGKAPPFLPIDLTLSITMSTEIPDVVLNKHQVVADRKGTFQGDIPIAPGYLRGAILTLVASSVPGVSSSKAQIFAKGPNQGVVVPIDQLPR